MRALTSSKAGCLDVILVLCVLAGFVSARWAWKCDGGGCERTSSLGDGLTVDEYPSLELCRLVCGSSGGVWPIPSVYSVLNKELLYLDVANITFNIKTNDDASKAFLTDVLSYFKDSVGPASSNCSETVTSLSINVEARSESLNLNWDTNETYTLNGQGSSITIVGETVFGVRHGLETLLQLIVKDGACFVSISSYVISDKPFYKHRGLLLDTARNYLSVDMIKRNIVGMAMSKLNVLHWHMSDSQSFPFVSSRVLNMSRYGAYGDEKVYSPEQVLDLIRFAKIRGVRIIPEIDGPAHVGNGWQWGPEVGLGNLVVCQNKQPWRSYCIQPPCGQLNPANQNIYEVLKNIYNDIVDLWKNLEAFHMGGDEVYIPCWNSSSEILKYIGNSRTEERFLDLWAEFQAKALEVFDSVNGGSSASAIVWTSSLTAPGVVENSLPNDRYVIQTWVPNSDNLPEELLALGYRVIISTKDSWYLDHGFWGSTSYYTWRKVYDNKILTDDGVLGGEVCMWGELVDDNNVESRVWPRAAAAAERLWSNPSTTSVSAEKRFFVHNRRLADRGIRTSVVTPEYCVQNENDCDGYLTYYRF
ncbi:beta-hexosaminidase 2 [Rhynchophorus ferrugineus]|uniref:beta-hexosaminidase 2 n=1 Tax=Rhynchophorus ferrugineus TaxID=354439 RepID=UPI003FCDD05A